MNDPKVLQTANSILDLNFLECCGSTAKRTRENILDAFAADHTVVASVVVCVVACDKYAADHRPTENIIPPQWSGGSCRSSDRW